MKKSHSSIVLRSVMNEIISCLPTELPIFPFFGTLLGYTREAGPIEGDDDIDFYLEAKFFPELLSLIKQSTSFRIAYLCEVSPFLLLLPTSGPAVPVAIHGFRIRKSFLVERWNFSALPKIKLFELRIRKNLVFPLRFDDVAHVYMPRDARTICRYLYGRDWQSPQVKGVHYKHLSFLGRPIILRGIAAVALGQLTEFIRPNAKAVS